ncbi:hypothetical protein CWIS_09690 [Cellulomonas sp. A375-1]|nr:hypothetical protein CWIS_09690 [Cellulomonas sp. A375-1]
MTARAYWRARLVAGPLKCARCPRLVHPWQTWQVEHLVARALGGASDRSNEWVSHASCNARHGGKIGAARTNARRAASPSSVRLPPQGDRGIRGW